ncbi:MAG: PEP-CTERM sorting domain-containing protein [Gemmatimonadota bacterium]|nr:PEP-CTERM sorting domain-containing protein [Gemmatimonadota bacterium]
MEFRISRALVGAGLAAASMSVSAAAHAQATFTFEGVGNGGYSPAQNGVSLSQGGGNARDVGFFQATNQAAGANAFSVGTDLGCNHTPSGTTCGFNGNATRTNIYSVLTTGTFTLNSGFFKTGPYNPATSLAITGYNSGGTAIFTQVLALSSTLTQFTFNWAGVNDVIFTPTGSSVGSGYFLADDITVNAPTSSTAPEPGSLALLGTGLIGLGPVVRRKLNR